MGLQRKMCCQVDLEKIIRNHAWKCYLNSMGKTKSLLVKREKFDIEFQWDFLKFSHSTAMTRVEPEDELLNSVDFGTPNRDFRKSKHFKKCASPGSFYKSVSMDFDEPVALEEVTIENTTTAPEQYHISTEKSTSSTLAVQFIQNYCLGPVTNIELVLTDAEFSTTLCDDSQRLLITNTRQQEFETVNDLNLAGNFTVKPGARTKATLLAREQTEVRDFQIKTTVSLVIGCLPVTIKRKLDEKVLFTCFITSLADVFSRHVGNTLKLVETNEGVYDATIESNGRCKFTQWIDPQLILQSEALQTRN